VTAFELVGSHVQNALEMTAFNTGSTTFAYYSDPYDMEGSVENTFLEYSQPSSKVASQNYRRKEHEASRVKTFMV
jgi:hypothetical protein